MCQEIQDFKTSLIEDGKSTKTIESYVGDIKAFIEFLGSKGVEFNGTLQRFYVVSYKNLLVDSNYEVATINKKINSIHALNRYLVAIGTMKEIVVENSKDRIKKHMVQKNKLKFIVIRMLKGYCFIFRMRRR